MFLKEKLEYYQVELYIRILSYRFPQQINIYNLRNSSTDTLILELKTARK